LGLFPVFNQPGQLFADSEYTLHFSADGGQTWNPVALPRLLAQFVGGALAVDPGGARQVYAGTNGWGSGTVFGTHDEGNTWDIIFDRDDVGGGDTWVNGIVVNPRTPSQLYLLSGLYGTAKLLVSNDYGATWQSAADRANIRSNNVRTLFSPDSFTTLYLGSTGLGVFDRSDSTSWGEVSVSRDAGSTWAKVPFQKPNSSIVGIVAKPGLPDTLVVITNMVEIFCSTDGGNDWERVYSLSQEGWNPFNPLYLVGVDLQHPDLIVAGLGSTLVISEDFGRTWTERTPSAVASSGCNSVLVTHPQGSTRIVATHGAEDGKLDVSDDLGRTWVPFFTGIADALGVLAAADDGTFYATTRRNGVVRGGLGIPFFSAVSMRFDSTQVNSETRQALTVYNPGITPLTIPANSLGGRHTTQFRVSPASATIPPGQSQTFTITFAPIATGAKNAYLSIPYDSLGNAKTVALSGVGTRTSATQKVPRISLSASSLAFDSTNVGSTSQKTLTVSNPGTDSLSLTSISLTGTDAGQFTVSPTTAKIVAGQNQPLTVTFAPTSAGPKSAALSIAHNAAGSPSSVSLAGNGITSVPAIHLSATSLAFDTTQVGATSQQTLTLSNTGTAALSVTSISVTGIDASQFKSHPLLPP
jgi:photosystem II stability/assembly factor-like uncharacterized protein